MNQNQYFQNVNIYVKPVNKEVASAKVEKTEKPKTVSLVSYSSDEDEEADETPVKKIKQA